MLTARRDYRQAELRAFALSFRVGGIRQTAAARKEWGYFWAGSRSPIENSEVNG